jgi:fused signal recognition particle receptor
MEVRMLAEADDVLQQTRVIQRRATVLYRHATPVRLALVVAKLDGTARGGAVFGIHEALGLPVRYIGTGESLGDFEPFEPEPFVDAILGRL